MKNLRQQFLEHVGLTDAECAELLFRWTMYSVKDSIRILNKKFPSVIMP